MILRSFYRREPEVCITAVVGVCIMGVCGIVSYFARGLDWWDVFSMVETSLGYVANLAVVAAVIKFVTFETLDVKGIGKIKIDRRLNNISDLTNLISREFFDGNQFQRKPLLDAYYNEESLEIISREKLIDDYIAIKDTGSDSTFRISRNSVGRIDNLINALKCMLNEGNPLSNEMLAEVYGKWYRINEVAPDDVSAITVNYKGKSLTVRRNDIDKPEELVKVAQFVLNGGVPFDNTVISEIYKNWYIV